jgi:hypothetical protein
MNAKRTLAATLILAAAGTAHAQCNYVRYGVPDFDQRRDALANDGGYFCVPTSFTNIRGYIANHGYGAIMGGPRNWQSQANYNYVTARIDAMGDLMDTDPFNGTTGDNAKDGWNDFIDAFHEDKFVLSSWTGYCPPPWIFILFQGGITNICYGYYKQVAGVWDRDGGHCVTLVGLKDLCANFNEPTFRIRNPASDDGDLDVQSTFSTEETRTDAQSFNLNGSSVTRLRMVDFGAGSSTRRYMDKLYAVQPMIALTGNVTTQAAINLIRPLKLFGTSGFEGSSSGPSSLDAIYDIAMHPMGVESYIITNNAITGNKRLHKVDMATGTWTTLISSLGTTNSRVVSSRFGELFVYGDGSVRKYNVQGTTPQLLSSYIPVHPISGMAYDDALDEVVAVTTNSRMIRLGQQSLALIADQPLPGTLAIVGDGSVVPNPTTPGYWYIASSGSPVIAEITTIPGITRLQTTAAISLPPGTAPRSVQATNAGDLIFINNNQIQEFKRSMSPAGAPIWIIDPTSAFHGQPAARALAIARSRSNFVAGVHDQPKWQDDNYQPEGAPSIPDCEPDLNVDGIVDILDLLDFLNSFSVCNGEAGPCGTASVNADFNFDGTVDILDLLDYLLAFDKGC